MNQVNRHHHGPCQGKGGHRGGASSFWMHDPEVVFEGLALKEGDCFLDMGCGRGDYAIRASKIVGNAGRVYALDKWQPLVDGLKKEAALRGLENLRAIACDITQPLPIEDGCVDTCLLSTVLHIFNLSKIGERLFNEIGRALRPGGCVAVIECKKEYQAFGPPKHMRLSPEEIERVLSPYGFERVDLTDLGYNYMIRFAVDQGNISF